MSGISREWEFPLMAELLLEPPRVLPWSRDGAAMSGNSRSRLIPGTLKPSFSRLALGMLFFIPVPVPEGWEQYL